MRCSINCDEDFIGCKSPFVFEVLTLSLINKVYSLHQEFTPINLTQPKALRAAELPVVVMNPRRVREFAKACGKLAKTDGIDAHILALFGCTMKPQLRAHATSEEESRKALLIR